MYQLNNAYLISDINGGEQHLERSCAKLGDAWQKCQGEHNADCDDVATQIEDCDDGDCGKYSYTNQYGNITYEVSLCNEFDGCNNGLMLQTFPYAYVLLISLLVKSLSMIQ